MVLLCCIISIYTCNKCWKYEKTVDENDYNIGKTITKTQYIMNNKSETMQRISEKLEPIKLAFNNKISIGTTNVVQHIEQELEMAQITQLKHVQSHSQSNSIRKHIQKQTLSETEPGLMKMNTAQQELELHKIFEEMMDDTNEQNQKKKNRKTTLMTTIH
eukprot:264665_1